MANFDSVDHLTVDTMVDRGSVRAALLDDVNLVEWGEKTERSIPTANRKSFVQRLKDSRESFFNEKASV